MSDLDEEISELREKTTLLRRNLVLEFDTFLIKHLEEFIKDINPQKKTAHRRPTSKNSKIPEKEFVCRDSIISRLLRLKYFETVFNILLGLAIVVLSNSFLHLNGHNIMDNFTHIFFIFLMECAMTLSFLFIYGFGWIWTICRPTTKQVTNVDYIFGGFYIIYISCFMLLPPMLIFQVQPSLCSRMVILCEQVRILMKIHSFLRYIIAFTFSIDQNNDTKDRSFPSFRSFLYYFLAPTLLYRREYPRCVNRTVNWWRVGYNGIQFCLCALIFYFLYTDYCLIYMRQFRDGHKNVETVCVLFLRVALPALLSLFMVFYSFQHCWLNMFAELLLFGDRFFYKDWWTSVHFSEFFRSWNLTVHDWLHFHIYRDICLLLGMRFKLLGRLLVFVISAVIHEYIVFVALGFYYPVLLVLFLGFGTLLTSVPRIKILPQLTNVLFILSLTFGFAVFFIFYTLEFHTRKNCVPMNHSMWNIVLPAIYLCQIRV